MASEQQGNGQGGKSLSAGLEELAGQKMSAYRTGPTGSRRNWGDWVEYWQLVLDWGKTRSPRDRVKILRPKNHKTMEWDYGVERMEIASRQI